MKNLANCTDIEFLAQTNKIRKQAEAWLKSTGILTIREQKPPVLPEDMPEDQKREAIRKDARRRINAMLDAALENHTEETARLLRMMCFVDPDDNQAMTGAQLLGAAAEMLGNEEILDFFTSLGRLGLMNT